MKSASMFMRCASLGVLLLVAAALGWACSPKVSQPDAPACGACGQDGGQLRDSQTQESANDRAVVDTTNGDTTGGDVAQGETAPTEPGSGESAPTEAGSVEPVNTDSGNAEPVKVEPPVEGASEPAMDGGVVEGLPETGSCPEGTCRLPGRKACEKPTGPVGNGCCKCEGDTCTGLCMCNAPHTRIATPTGERNIADLRVGDLVYSVHQRQIVAVPIIRLSRVAVSAHRIVDLRLADGTRIETSPAHPTADGRTFAMLRPGDILDGLMVRSAKLVSYPHPYTYDILPRSETGSYFANGVRIGSTLRALAVPVCR